MKYQHQFYLFIIYGSFCDALSTSYVFFFTHTAKYETNYFIRQILYPIFNWYAPFIWWPIESFIGISIIYVTLDVFYYVKNRKQRTRSEMIILDTFLSSGIVLFSFFAFITAMLNFSGLIHWMLINH